jgi:hypothetical protein
VAVGLDESVVEVVAQSSGADDLGYVVFDHPGVVAVS